MFSLVHPVTRRAQLRFHMCGKQYGALATAAGVRVYL
jgi:hypothetical protein